MGILDGDDLLDIGKTLVEVGTNPIGTALGKAGEYLGAGKALYPPGVPTGGASGLGDGIAKVIREALEAFFKNTEMQRVLGEAEGRIVGFAIEQAAALATPIAEGLSKISGSLGGKIPSVSASGPKRGSLGALDALGELRSFMDGIRPGVFVARADAAFGSLGALADEIAGGAGAVSAILKPLFAALKDLVTASSPEGALAKLLEQVFASAQAAASSAFNALLGNAWKNIPGGVPLGAIHRWVNGAPTALDREFRLRLSAALDCYFTQQMYGGSGRPSAEASRSRFDERDSTGILSDLFGLVIDTTILFVLEPEERPRAEAANQRFEDVGERLAASVGRQVRASVRSVVGTVLRGVWVFSVGNENLIESAGVIIGSVFGAVAEGIVRNLAWSIQITSVYSTHDMTLGLHHWSSGDRIGDSTDTLKYIAYLRTPVGSIPLPALPSGLQGILEDIGAYLDLSYRQHPIASRFPDVGERDDVYVTRAEMRDGKTLVWASSSRCSELPAPVLRVYAGERMLVLAPGTSPYDPCKVEIDMSGQRVPRRIQVLSNRGGSATVPVIGAR